MFDFDFRLNFSLITIGWPSSSQRHFNSCPFWDIQSFLTGMGDSEGRVAGCHMDGGVSELNHASYYVISRKTKRQISLGVQDERSSDQSKAVKGEPCLVTNYSISPTGSKDMLFFFPRGGEGIWLRIHKMLFRVLDTSANSHVIKRNGDTMNKESKRSTPYYNRG